MSKQVFDTLSPTRPSLTFFDKVSLLSFRIFRRPAGRISRSIPLLREDLLKSNMRVTPTGLVSVALLAATISTIGVLTTLGIASVLLARYFVYALLVTPLPLILFILILNGPKISQSSRATSLDNELPFVIGYMSILAGGGLSLIDSLRRISLLNIFPAAAYEAKRILIDIDSFGRDPLSALDRASKYTPSRALADLLAGYTTVLRTGGDFVNYLNLNLKESFEQRAERVKRTVETIGLVAEAYLIVTVVLGVALFTLYLVESLIDSNSGGITSVYFFSFGIVPLLSAVFVWLLDVVQPKWPFTDLRPYIVFLLGLPIGVVIYLIPLPLKFYLHLAVALIAISLAPTYFAAKYSRQRRAVERMLPDFINDVSEGRKIGLPPEASIERLEETDYRELSTYVHKMGAQLSWGVALSKVVSTFVASVNSWLAKAIGTLMLEVVEIGGGTTKGFAEMADFTRRISNIEAERRGVLRPYVLIAYLGGMMLIMTTFIMIVLLAAPASSGFVKGATALSAAKIATVDTLVGASIFESWAIGLVAGKMGEGSLSDGFKHGLALVLLNLIAIVIGRLFIPIPL